jgi:hypothetical protein
MDDIRLFASSSVRSRLTKGRFPRVIMLLSVKSIASCWSCASCKRAFVWRGKNEDAPLLHQDSRWRVFYILGTVQTYGYHRDSRYSPLRSSWRSLLGFMPETAWARSSGVSFMVVGSVTQVAPTRKTPVSGFVPTIQPGSSHEVPPPTAQSVSAHTRAPRWTAHPLFLGSSMAMTRIYLSPTAQMFRL